MAAAAAGTDVDVVDGAQTGAGGLWIALRFGVIGEIMPEGLCGSCLLWSGPDGVLG